MSGTNVDSEHLMERLRKHVADYTEALSKGNEDAVDGRKIMIKKTLQLLKPLPVEKVDEIQHLLASAGLTEEIDLTPYMQSDGDGRQHIYYEEHNLIFIGKYVQVERFNDYYSNRIRGFKGFPQSHVAFFVEKLKCVLNAKPEYFERLDAVCCVPTSSLGLGSNSTEQPMNYIADYFVNELKVLNISDVFKRKCRPGKSPKPSLEDQFDSIEVKAGSESKIQNQRILLIDDVYTTGATYKAAREHLKLNRAKLVKGLILAKTGGSSSSLR